MNVIHNIALFPQKFDNSTFLKVEDDAALSNVFFSVLSTVPFSEVFNSKGKY